MPGFWNRWNERVQENASGILGTIAFHLVLIVIFLILKISTERARMENLIMVDFEELPEEEQTPQEPDPEFAEKLARYLEEPASNVPVNVARQIEQDLSTENYVRELEEDLDASRPESWKEMQERLKDLEELQQEEIVMGEEDSLSREERTKTEYVGPTNIYYDLEYRYHLRLPVPVYKCEGDGLVEVRIVVDQQGRVEKAETEKPGETANEICLAEAAVAAALKTRFNSDYDAPPHQVGTISYHFIAQ